MDNSLQNVQEIWYIIRTLGTKPRVVLCRQQAERSEGIRLSI